MMQTLPTTYLLARLPIGVSFLGHGVARIPKISAFAEGMAQTFQDSILPHPLILVFGHGLPFLELFLGIFLLLGLAIRFCTIVGVGTHVPFDLWLRPHGKLDSCGHSTVLQCVPHTAVSLCRVQRVRHF